MTVENLPYSFVQMIDPATAPISDCSGPATYPVVNGDDAVFQFVIVAANATELQAFLSNHPIRLYYNGALVTTAINWKFLDLGNNRVLIYVPQTGVPGISNIAVGTCFRFVFIYDATNIGPYSPCFKKVESTANTTQWGYKSDENQNGFNYCDTGLQNRIRLWANLTDMQYEDQDNVIYRYSDGRVKTIAARTYEVYQVTTDLLPNAQHRAINAMLISDEIHLESDLYTGDVAKNGQYQITRTGINYMRGEGVGQFNVYATPFVMVNDNCGTCQ